MATKTSTGSKEREPEQNPGSGPEPLAVIDLPVSKSANGDAWRSAVHRATARHSTFYVRNHGTEALQNEMFGAARRFFALPTEERVRLSATGALEFGHRADDSGINEAFSLSRRRGGGELSAAEARLPAELRDVIDRYLSSMFALEMTILDGMEEGLGLERHRLRGFFVDDAIETLQLRRYRATARFLDPHTDPPPITMIAQEEVGGLETLTEGTWQPVPPIPGTMICQVGAIMGCWTDNRYSPCVHRVVSVENTERYTLVYKLLPAATTVIESLQCFKRQGQPVQPQTTVGAFLEEWFRNDRAHTTVGAAASGASSAVREPSQSDDLLLGRLRDVVSRGSGGRATLERVSRSEAGLRMDLIADGEPLVLEMAPCQAGRKYYRTLGELGFWYHGQIKRPELLVMLRGVIDASAPFVAVWFHEVRSRSKSEVTEPEE